MRTLSPPIPRLFSGVLFLSFTLATGLARIRGMRGSGGCRRRAPPTGTNMAHQSRKERPHKCPHPPSRARAAALGYIASPPRGVGPALPGRRIAPAPAAFLSFSARPSPPPAPPRARGGVALLVVDHGGPGCRRDGSTPCTSRILEGRSGAQGVLSLLLLTSKQGRDTTGSQRGDRWTPNSTAWRSHLRLNLVS